MKERLYIFCTFFLLKAMVKFRNLSNLCRFIPGTQLAPFSIGQNISCPNKCVLYTAKNLSIGLATIILSDSTFLHAVCLEFDGIKVLQNCLRKFGYLMICVLINSQRQVRYSNKVIVL